ncbi:MAG: tRNA-dihydrouridine synthase [Proteobacteria bacterium]|nr:tRNA-dihydrouridine synthase [Cystobacterineae bacterium]MCL2259355.1 tRNA-dihydrouridine synthase [Cystobacterineae bacterium]MCL2313680.1 tRNA-dihydrouridine synthase [Pseudomonadota bacterium]
MPHIASFSFATPYALAPMAGVSEEPFRLIARRMGASHCPTELVSAQGLLRKGEGSLRYLRHQPELEHPFCVQLFGGEAGVLAKAAICAKQLGAQMVDLNMGCPVKKVTKTGAGAALMLEPLRAADICKAIAEATGLPVTAKIRTGWDAQNQNYLEVAEALAKANIAALAVHPRTRAQGYAGKADWGVIKRLKQCFGNTFALLGNGDVRCPADAVRMQEETGCDFVMIGRGALGNPWIFRQLLGGCAPSCEERFQVVWGHFEAYAAWIGDTGAAVRCFRKQWGYYSHGLEGASAFRAAVYSIEEAELLRSITHRFFMQAKRVEGSREGEGEGGGWEEGGPG